MPPTTVAVKIIEESTAGTILVKPIPTSKLIPVWPKGVMVIHGSII